MDQRNATKQGTYTAVDPQMAAEPVHDARERLLHAPVAAEENDVRTAALGSLRKSHYQAADRLYNSTRHTIIAKTAYSRSFSAVNPTIENATLAIGVAISKSNPS